MNRSLSVVGALLVGTGFAMGGGVSAAAAPAALPPECTPAAPVPGTTVTCRYDIPGRVATFTVPTGVGLVRVTASGGRGGEGAQVNGSAGGSGGLGARVTGDVDVRAGDTLTVQVGGAAPDPRGPGGATSGGGGGATGGVGGPGYGSGGAGGAGGDVNFTAGGGGGGGGSAVLDGRNAPLLVAAGGGGGGGGIQAGLGGAGGAAGTPGEAGGRIMEVGAGGPAGVPGSGHGPDGDPGGSANLNPPNGGAGGGGGGGGLVGGSGGRANPARGIDSAGGGGGGGASLTPAGGTLDKAANSGSGSVVLSYTQPTPVAGVRVTGAAQFRASGQTVNLRLDASSTNATTGAGASGTCQVSGGGYVASCVTITSVTRGTGTAANAATVTGTAAVPGRRDPVGFRAVVTDNANPNGAGRDTVTVTVDGRTAAGTVSSGNLAVTGT